MPRLVTGSCAPTWPRLIKHIDPRPLHLQRGWVSDGDVWRGRYETPFGSWRGEISERSWRGWSAYIFSPPHELVALHPKRDCFKQKESDRWHIHLHEQPDKASVGDLIFFVEGILAEAFIGR